MTKTKATQAAPKIGVEVQTITPELAEDWLGRNSHNRTLRNGHVAALAGAMKRGEWSLNGDAIRFAADGTLLDGQHRLWAVIEADVPIESLVIDGLPNDAQDTMDAGARRRLSDALKLRDETNPAALAALITYHWRYQQGMVRTQLRPTVAQALSHLDANPGLRDALSLGKRVNNRFRVSASMIGTLAYEFSAIDGEDAEEFWTRLIAGTNLEEGSPIIVLRRWMERQSSLGVGSRTSAVVSHALTVKAWNAWRDGRIIDSLKWKASGPAAEAFPVPR